MTCSKQVASQRKSLCLGVLLSDNDGGLHHVLECLLSLNPTSGLEAAVGVDPKLLVGDDLTRLAEKSGHLLHAG